MDIVVIVLFCALLLICVVLDFSILIALAGGFVIFFLYGLKRGYRCRELLKMAFSGVKTVKNILITFLLIGILTALWRDAGTIAAIVCYASGAIRPEIFLVMAFLLNCLVSFLTGTAFGTAATMGVICATMGTAMGVNGLYVGGAVLAGSFFGDRCSPVSTSALLVATLTQTNIYNNIKNMIKTAAVPLAVTVVAYLLLGLEGETAGQIPDLWYMFGKEFRLGWIPLLPAAVMLLLSLLRVNVKLSMTTSILTALPICLFYQNTAVTTLPGLAVSGFFAEDSALSHVLNGGGILSMVKVASIVCLSSSYSEIFQKTGLLDRAKKGIELLAAKTTSFTAMVLTSVLSGMVACNQTLAIMLTHQLCRETEPEKERMALRLEDSAVVISSLIPWSIAGSVPLASVGAPAEARLFAFFLYLLPLWGIFVAHPKKGKACSVSGHILNG